MRQFLSMGLLVAVIVGLARASTDAAEFYVSPTGTAEADGSRERPWDLVTGLSAAAVKPGDTVWIEGGTYNGSAHCRLAGTAEAPITVRAAPGERVTLDFNLGPVDRERLLVIEGDHVTLWGMELTCSDEKRVTELPGSWPADINRGGIHCRASHVKFINLVVHDSGGIGFWAEGVGGEVYGSIIYHNGWKGPDRGHGHGIYAQNKASEKRLADNVIFNHFGDGIHVYGSDKASLVGFRIEGNVLFNNGCLNGPGDRTRNLLVGGGSPADRIAVLDNCTYHSGLTATTVQLGYAAVDLTAEVRGNRFIGMTRVLNWQDFTFTGNTLVSVHSTAELTTLAETSLAGYHWDRNTFFSAEEMYSPLSLRQGEKQLALDWSAWQAAGLDTNSRYVRGRPEGVDVIVRPNQYEPGRAHVVVYNWDGATEAAADLSGVLTAGQKYSIVRAQDFFGQPVVAGSYDGQPVRIPLAPLPCTPPVGLPDIELPVTGPEFDVFVVLPVGG